MVLLRLDDLRIRCACDRDIGFGPRLQTELREGCEPLLYVFYPFPPGILIEFILYSERPAASAGR